MKLWTSLGMLEYQSGYLPLAAFSTREERASESVMNSWTKVVGMAVAITWATELGTPGIFPMMLVGTLVAEMKFWTSELEALRG